MICRFVAELLQENYRIAVTAATGKATAVLRSKIWETLRELNIDPKDNLCIETISKITKESKVVGLTDSGETLYSNKWKNPKSFGYDVLFVDELSMVPQFVSQWWLLTDARVFGFGDYCQLPEVVTNDTRKELNGMRDDLKLPEMKYVSGYGVKVLKAHSHKELTEVLRSDNEVALICNDLRDFRQSKQKIVKTIKDWAAQTDNIQYSTTIDDLEIESDWQIIAYTNEMCRKINNQLCIGEEYPTLSDKILLTDNINPLALYNGDTMLFGNFLESIAKYNLKASRKIYVCMKWQGQMPRKDSKNEIERNFFNIYISFKAAIEIVNNRRMKELPNIIQESGWAQGQIKEWLEDIKEMQKLEPNSGKCFQTILEKFEETDHAMALHIAEHSERLPALYVVNCDYGYCVTTHRAQGSEYEKVCYLLERFDRPLIYTGISRAKKRVKIINLTNER